MKVAIISVLLTMVVLYGREQYRRGVEDANFDRESANIKLQNCSEVISKFSLEH